MPNHKAAGAPLHLVFKALADETRMAVVERLSVGPASATELARPFEMALPSFMQHLGVLEYAGVVMSHKTGRTRVYQIAPAALGAASAWLGTHRNHWERRLDQLDELLGGAPADPSDPRSNDERLHTQPGARPRAGAHRPRRTRARVGRLDGT